MTPSQHVPTDTRHVVDDPEKTLVHVTHFNRLMWHNGRTPAYVIDHGIIPSAVSYNGDIKRGIVIINNLSERGRRMGYDIFQEVRERVPLDLIGMDTIKLGGWAKYYIPNCRSLSAGTGFSLTRSAIRVLVWLYWRQ